MRVERKVLQVSLALAGLLGGAGIASAQGAPRASAAAAHLAPWKTVVASGQVEARAPSSAEDVWRRIARGDRLSPQTTVRTGRKGRATLARHGSLLIVDRDSSVDLPSVVEEGSASSVMQNRGRVVYEIEKGGARHFEVVTPYLVAGVKGTTFIVTVDDGTASVTVRDGIVEVTSAMTGEKTDVHAGETVLLGSDSDSRMELVSSRPGEPGVGRGDKRETDARARDDAARMANLLGSDDSRRSSPGEDRTRDALDPTTRLPAGDAGRDLDDFADDLTRTDRDRGSVDSALDPLQDPVNILPGRPDPTREVDPPDHDPGSDAPGPGDTTSDDPIRVHFPHR